MSPKSRSKTLRLDQLEARAVPAILASFNPTTGVFTVSGDQLDNTINIAADAAGNLIVNGGVVLIFGGTPTVANTTLIRLLGNRGNDTLQVLGALHAAVINGGAGTHSPPGGGGADQPT